MKRDYKQTDEQPARTDECQVIITGLILFILSTSLRHFGPGGGAEMQIIPLPLYPICQGLKLHIAHLLTLQPDAGLLN